MLRLLAIVPLLALSLLLHHSSQAETPREFFQFSTQEIDKSLSVGYAVLLVDVNADKKLDIVVVDTKRVVWFENPSWKLRTITEGKTIPDNVCIAAHDIDGDGKVDFALGADWKPFNTKAGGTLQWLKQPASLEEPWKVYPIGEEPTVHRIRFADLDGSGKASLLVGPLMGRNSTAAKNWVDGSPVRLLALTIPKDPTKDRWVPEVVDESLHVMHNFVPIPAKKGMDVLTASYDGVYRISKESGKWVKHKVGEGNQANPKGSRGASEIKLGKLKNGTEYIATIEPWHGNQVVVYTRGEEGKLWNRQVLDEQLKWGHAVWCADLDGDGSEELVIGVRDQLSKRPGEGSGVRIYQATNDKATNWRRMLLDENGVAVEDLACADLDGDGKVDIVAVGRASKNVRLYRNQTK
jgi:hypothetical protein